MSANDTRRDIIDSGTVTASGSPGAVQTPWISTLNANSVRVLIQASISAASCTCYVYDSNDQSTVLYVTPITVTDTFDGLSIDFVPGAAYMSLELKATAGTTFTYSIRAIG